MKSIISLFAIFSLQFAMGQSFTEKNLDINDLISGTLYVPEKSSETVIVISVGSGPTDRNGNGAGVENNSIRFLAEALAEKGYAVFSYDKRFFKQLKTGAFVEENLSFNDMVTDAKSAAMHFQTDKTFKRIVLLGHSEGALVMAIAAQDPEIKKLAGYISLAGAGRPAGEIIVEQIVKQAPGLKADVQTMVDKLNSGQKFKLENAMLASLFRESAQPYLISWFKYDPVVEIKKVKVPCLVINGTSDLQVPIEDAQKLSDAKRLEKPILITNMNHVLRIVKDQQDNFAAYSDDKRPIATELVPVIDAFVKTIGM